MSTPSALGKILAGSGPSSPTPLATPDIEIFDLLSDAKAIQRTKSVSHLCSAIHDEDRATLSTEFGSRIYEFFTKESILSMQMYVGFVEGKFVSVNFSAVKMSGDKEDVYPEVKNAAMKFLLGYLTTEKVNLTRYPYTMCTVNFKINDDALLFYAVEVVAPGKMESISRASSVSIFDPGKAEDF